MNVLLLNPSFTEKVLKDNYCCHTTKGNHYWPPSDLIYISSILNHHDINLWFIDEMNDINNQTPTIKLIRGELIDVLVVLTGTITIESDYRAIEELKQSKPGLKVFIIGNIASFATQKVMESFPLIDGVFHNFFDHNIRDFLLGNQSDTSSITFRNSNTIEYGTHNIVSQLRSGKPLPAPKHSLFVSTKYKTPVARNTPMMTSITSYGCVYNCKFCIASAINYYERSIDSLKVEFDSMSAAGVKEIFFMDSTFNTKNKRVLEICELLKSNNYGFSWSCNIHSSKADKETLLAMKEAGCHTVQIGVESFNGKSLDDYAPSKNVEKLKDTFSFCKQIGISTLGYFIIGFPSETKQDVERTINFAISLDPKFASFSTLVPDYGTEFHQEAIERGYISDSNSLQVFNNSSKAILKNTVLSARERNQLVKSAYIKFYFRPLKILEFFFDIRFFPQYFKNAVSLLKNQIILRK